jgi:hypothetical protein
MGSTPEEVQSLQQALTCDEPPPCSFLNEIPHHRVRLDNFYIDRNEVRNAIYEEFLTATGRKRRMEDLLRSRGRLAPPHPVEVVTGTTLTRTAGGPASGCRRKPNGKRRPAVQMGVATPGAMSGSRQTRTLISGVRVRLAHIRAGRARMEFTTWRVTSRSGWPTGTTPRTMPALPNRTRKVRRAVASKWCGAVPLSLRGPIYHERPRGSTTSQVTGTWVSASAARRTGGDADNCRSECISFDPAIPPSLLQRADQVIE